MKIELHEEAEKNKDTHYFSISQVKTFRECPKRWAAYYLDKVKRPFNPSAQKGVELHGILEKYLIDGIRPDPKTPQGAILEPGLIYLPNPGLCSVEYKFQLSIDDIYFRGVIDCLYNDEIPTILDHKTTVDLKYALSSKKLSQDLQANLYALYAMVKYGKNKADLRWVYYKTRDLPESKLVKSEITLTDAYENIKNILDDCRIMLDAKKEGKTAADFNHPKVNCRDYGAACLGETMKKRSLSEFLSDQQETLTIQEAVPDPAPVKKQEPELTQKLNPKEEQCNCSFTLLIDSLPQKLDSSEIVQFSTILKPVFAQIAKEYNVSHYSFVPYGEGRARFVTLLDRELSENPLNKGQTVLVSLGSPEARDSLEVLVEHATRVFRATK